MLKLTQEQFDWLHGVQQSSVNHSLVAVLDEHWPELAARLGARKHAFVEAALAQAHQHGLDDPRAAARYVNFWCVWGPAFIDKPGFEWASMVVRDRRLDAWAKVEQLTLLSLDLLQRSSDSVTVSPDKFDETDQAMAAAVGRLGVTGAGEGAAPAERAACDLSAFDVAVSEQTWRAEYRLAWSGSEVLSRLAPITVPAQHFHTDEPQPPDAVPAPRQLAALALPAARGHKAWLMVRASADHVCDAQTHPRLELKAEVGGQILQGAPARLAKLPLHSVDVAALPPPFALPEDDSAKPVQPGDPVRTDFTKGLLCRQVAPRYLHVSAQTCAHRRYGAPLGEQQCIVAIHPADQWLLEVKTAPQPLWHWPDASPRESVAPPAVRLERDGVPQVSQDWARASTQLGTALAGGFSAWHAALLKADVLLSPRLDVEPGLMHGSMAWTWGMREVVQPEGSSAYLRVQALIRLMACSMDLQVSGDVQHQSARARLRLRAKGEAPLHADVLHESPEEPVAGRLSALKATWAFPFAVEVESLASPLLGSMALAEGGKPFHLVGEVGLRPRPDGAGWAWYATVKLEAAVVPLLVSDPQQGQVLIQRDLWAATVLVDWSAG